MKANIKLILSVFSLFLVSCDNKTSESVFNSNSDIIESDEIFDSDEIVNGSGSFESDESSDSVDIFNSSENFESSDIIDNIPSIDSNSSTSYPSIDSSTSSNFIKFDKPKSIYINPSVQYANLYVNNLGNEAEHMQNLGKVLVGMLKNNTNLNVYSNTSYPYMSLSQSVKHSNSLDVDYHLALHSNAGGGYGSEAFYTKTSKQFAKSIIDSMEDVLPYKTRGIKYGQDSLYELKRTTARACLVEVLFHDEVKQATFIVENIEEIAKAIFDGIISYLK